MPCPNCFHNNYTLPPLDDLTAACVCDCHDVIEEEFEDVFEDDYF